MQLQQDRRRGQTQTGDGGHGGRGQREARDHAARTTPDPRPGPRCPANSEHSLDLRSPAVRRRCGWGQVHPRPHLDEWGVRHRDQTARRSVEVERHDQRRRDEQRRHEDGEDATADRAQMPAQRGELSASQVLVG